MESSTSTKSLFPSPKYSPRRDTNILRAWVVHSWQVQRRWWISRKPELQTSNSRSNNFLAWIQSYLWCHRKIYPCRISNWRLQLRTKLLLKLNNRLHICPATGRSKIHPACNLPNQRRNKGKRDTRRRLRGFFWSWGIHLKAQLWWLPTHQTSYRGQGLKAS